MTQLPDGRLRIDGCYSAAPENTKPKRSMSPVPTRWRAGCARPRGGKQWWLFRIALGRDLGVTFRTVVLATATMVLFVILSCAARARRAQRHVAAVDLASMMNSDPTYGTSPPRSAVL